MSRALTLFTILIGFCPSSLLAMETFSDWFVLSKVAFEAYGDKCKDYRSNENLCSKNSISFGNTKLAATEINKTTYLKALAKDRVDDDQCSPHLIQKDFVDHIIKNSMNGNSDKFWNYLSKDPVGQKIWDRLFDAEIGEYSLRRPENISKILNSLFHTRNNY